jgi:EmrB/QacA subfamily drug resistance transporter
MSPADMTADPRRWYALVLLCFAFFMTVLGSTSVFTAAPAIARDLALPDATVQWIFTACALANAGLLLLGGRLSDAWGARRIFLAGIVLFVVSSLLCGSVSAGTVLIGARIAQGMATAIMSPAALSLVMTIFPDKAERNKALGAWSAIGGIGATAGLLVGGAVTAGLGWRWVFLINVPVGVAITVLTPLLIRKSRDRVRTRILDPAGAVTVTAALAVFVYAVTEAPSAGWLSVRTIGLLVVAAILAVSFGVIERRSRAPLLPPRLLRSRTLLGGNLVMLAGGMSVDGMLFVYTLYTQRVLGYSAVQFGLTMTVMTATSVVGSYVAQRAVTRIGFTPVAITGLAMLGASCFLLSRISAQASFFGDQLPSLTLFGLGMGGAFVAGSIASLSDVPERDSGVAAGLQSTSFTIGTALGVSMMSTVATSRSTALLNGDSASPAILTDAYRWAFTAGIVVAILAVGGALALFRRRPLPIPAATGRSE